MLAEKNKLGPLGEKIAADYLRSKGYQILDFNFKNNFGRRLGEIDIVSQEKKTGEIVFVEVKTRDISRYAETLPEENITHSKIRKLEKIAQIYLKMNKQEDCPYRFDAISVWTDNKGEQIKIKHIPFL